MKKKIEINKIIKPVLLVLFFLVIISSYMTGGFYAKYATTSSGSDSARVAKFDIKIDDTQGKFVSENFVISDFVPGKSETRKLQITNSSEVAVKYTLTVKTTGNLPLNIKVEDVSLNSSNELVYMGNIAIGGSPVELEMLIEFENKDEDNYLLSYELDKIDIILSVEQID